MSNDAGQPEFIDVRELMTNVSVEELCLAAEEFFARRLSWDSLQAKPFAEIDEAPELLIGFGQVLRGLNLLPDMSVLDFGAGSCWTSRFLSQLGLKVIALDVSSSALKMGRKLYQRHPLIGKQPKPEFLLFDGKRINLPNQSVDRISCWEAFHHVPNPDLVIKEMGRILKVGGIAGFSEPGPHHSKSEQSQHEMRTYRTIENDVNVHEIWAAARSAGFTDMRLSVFNADPVTVSLEKFDHLLSGIDTGEAYLAALRRQMQERRLFFLIKGDTTLPADSRRRDGLHADLEIEPSAATIRKQGSVNLKVRVKNTGQSIWLPTHEEPEPWWKKGWLARFGKRRYMGPDRIPPRVGGVRFAIQLQDHAGNLIDRDYFRYHLTRGEGRGVTPGETIEFEARVPMMQAGKYILKCGLVSEFVCWFEDVGSEPVHMPITVVR
ncbi:MAG TPA: class I SAM-dependent methyltransferase [Pyrinomonadaceae bacterium]|jgi:SAM-dependent methyltransferase|nr:class I SAM-dependent methyltransferase [Pyrinomonadaceae bacterium]